MLKIMGKKNLQFYAEHFSLSKPVIIQNSIKKRENCGELSEREQNQNLMTCCLIILAPSSCLTLPADVIC